MGLEVRQKREEFPFIFQNAKGKDVGIAYRPVIQVTAQQLHTFVDAVTHCVPGDKQDFRSAGKAFVMFQIDLEGDAKPGIMLVVVRVQLPDYLMAELPGHSIGKGLEQVKD